MTELMDTIRELTRDGSRVSFEFGPDFAIPGATVIHVQEIPDRESAYKNCLHVRYALEEHHNDLMTNARLIIIHSEIQEWRMNIHAAEGAAI